MPPDHLSAPRPVTPSDLTEDRSHCSRAQRREIEEVSFDLIVEPNDEVTSSLSGSSDRAADLVRTRVPRVAEKMRKVCGFAPSGMAELLRVARRTGASLDDRGVDAVVAGYLRWADSVGHGAAARAKAQVVNECREFLRDFSASYRVWWRWTDTGRAWWVELTFDNRTGRTVAGSMDGAATASRAQEWDFISERPVRGSFADAHFAWGGSSADYFHAPPGVSQQLVAPSTGTDVFTSSDGKLEVDEAELHGGGLDQPGWGCAIPVPEAS